MSADCYCLDSSCGERGETGAPGAAGAEVPPPGRAVPVCIIMGGDGLRGPRPRLYKELHARCGPRARVGSCVIFKTSFQQGGNHCDCNGIAVASRKRGNAHV